MTRRFLGSARLGELRSKVGPIRVVDVGARRGPSRELRELGPDAAFTCFEPDAEECARLTAELANDVRLGAVRFIPKALAGESGPRPLHLTVARDCSTMLEPLPEVGRAFGRDDFVTVEHSVEVDAVTLDQASDEYDLHGTSYLEIDVEGMELEILKSAPRFLSTVVAIRAEVAFLRIRDRQPTYTDISSFLREQGFEPLGFVELRHWRREARGDDRYPLPLPIPWSRGQIAHGDMLFVREASRVEDGRALVHQALVALLHGFVDHAAYLLRLERVRPHLDGLVGGDLRSALAVASCTAYLKSQRRTWSRRARALKRGLLMLIR